MSTTLVLPADLWAELTSALNVKDETAGVLLARDSKSSEHRTLLVRRILWVPDHAYELRTPTALKISSSGYVPALKAADDEDCVAIFFHTHPTGPAGPSRYDLMVDESLADPFLIRTGKTYASLIVGGTVESPRFTGTVADTTSQIDRIRVVGSRLRVLQSDSEAGASFDLTAFDRQIRAFGVGGQRFLRELRVGVVGAGGTGSAVFEQLCRLGVQHIMLIDDDVITETNLTRIHESGHADIGREKVEVATRGSARIGLGTQPESRFGRITNKDHAAALMHCDVIFGCTDDNRGRAILSRLAYWYLVPVIDCAFMVDSDGEYIRGLFGRVSTLFPGASCLICRGRIDQAQLAAESLPPQERERLAAEGYVPGLNDPDPSVVAYTTLVASFAVNELLDRLFGYGGDDPPTEMLIRLHDRQISTRHPEPLEGHYCHDRNNWGRGDQEPFLDQLWQ